MKVTNKTEQSIKVSINKWGNSGDTSYFSIGPYKTGTWDRSDERGFVMLVSIDGTSKPYYIQSNHDIIIYSDSVKNGNKDIFPVN